jgi:hypothetical protein
MPQDRPERPPALAFADAIGVKRNVAIGVAVGVSLAALAYLFRVLELAGPFGGTRQFPILGETGWFLMLAFVLASSTALLVATALSVVSLVRLARTTE